MRIILRPHDCVYIHVLWFLAYTKSCVCLVDISGDRTDVEVGNAHCWQSNEAKPVCATQHQPSRTERESEGGM